MKRYQKRRPATVTLLATVILLGILILNGCSTPLPDPTATATSQPEPTEAPTEAPTPTAEPEMEAPTATPTEAPTATTEPSTATPEPTEAPMMTEQTIDGVVTEGEYDQQADFGDIRLWWRNDDTYLYLAIEGDTTGWVAVGINPQQGMQGADYLFGYVQDGEAMIWDAYGTSPTGANHPPDEDLGGTTDIEAYAGVEQDGVTTFEAQLPLNSGDEYDQVLEPGESYPIIVAIGGEDQFNAYHLRYDRGELSLMAP
jgi:hypothetical protein